MKMSRTLIGAETQPLICTPLVGGDRDEILAELEVNMKKKPDLIEWRADYFAAIGDIEEVIDMAGLIKRMVGETPVIFTIRSHAEGGQVTGLSHLDVVERNVLVCRETDIDYIDCELSVPFELILLLRGAADEYGARLIMSYHNFSHTPTREFLIGKVEEAATLRADVAKLAVMPEKPEDILTLLQVTIEAKSRFGIPLITMSMGGLGSLTRMFGGVFGSSVTFAVGKSGSAPGQVPIEDLRSVFALVQRSIGGGA
jgi:3-dehydroquinate dehydratase-1